MAHARSSAGGSPDRSAGRVKASTDRLAELDAFSSLEAQARAVARKEVSSRELLDLYLDRIARLEPRIQAFSRLFEEEARRAARAADGALAAGRKLGPLHGAVVAVKDIFDVAGHPTTAGSRALRDRHPTRSAAAVRRLERAGAVVVGKTRMVEFAFGGWGTNPLQGTPRNPWDLDCHRVPGGSSSGSAVAVAAGLASAALGTDTGGSIRTPAAWCGIVGLKTSSGLVSRDGVVPLCPTHDSVGPLTRSVRDAALLLDLLAGPDPDDAQGATAPRPATLAAIEGGVGSLRLGILGEDDLGCLDPEQRRLFDDALHQLRALGAETREVRLPLPVARYLEAGGEIMSFESFKHLGRYLEGADDLVHPVIRERIARGRDIPEATYRALLDERRAAQDALRDRLSGVDALIVPGCHQTAIPVAEVDEAAAPNLFGRFVNYLDLASLALPIGLTAEGLPVGLQVAVRRFDDALALRIGRAIEKSGGRLVTQPPAL